MNVVCVALLAAALIPALRVALKPPVWNELRARPILAAAVAAFGAMLIALLASHRSQLVALLPVVAAVAVLLALAAWVRARPAFGQGRGLPPGSLGVARSLDAITHADFYARSAATWGPVFKMAQFHRPVACIVDLPLGLEVLEQQRASLAQPTLPFGRLSPGNYIEFMNDERHQRYRGILRTALSGRVVAACREGVESVTAAQLATLTPPGEAHGAALDAVLDRVAFVSLLRVVCGIPVTDPRIDELQTLFGRLGSTRAFAERRPEERVAPFRALTDLVRALGHDISGRQATGTPPVPSVLSEILRADPAHLLDDTLIGNLVLIVHVTRSNVRGLLGWVLKEYVDHPGLSLLLRRAQAEHDGVSRMESVASQVVNETLRLHQSEYLYREVVREIRVGQWTIPRGWLLRVCVRECHDNPAVFPAPSEFRPERFAERHYTRSEYCPFSDGAHSCFGAGLSLMVARAMVTVLAREFDCVRTSDGPVERQGNRHWSHWRPSKRFGVRIAASTRSGVAGSSSTHTPQAS